MIGGYRDMARPADPALTVRIRRLRRRRHSTALRHGLVYTAWSLTFLVALALIAVELTLALRAG